MATTTDEVRAYGEVGPISIPDGNSRVMRLGKTGEVMTSNLHGQFYEQVYRRNVFAARAVVTAPVIFTTAAATGGPLLYNPAASAVNLVLLKAGIGATVVTTVAAALGITGGPTTAPTSTTAIDTDTNCFIGGVTHEALAYRLGTVSAAGTLTDLGLAPAF